MSKIAVVFWSGTGNTEAMADAVVEGIEAAGAECSKFSASDFNGGMINDFDAIAFGCPSMGSEQLEDSEFEPMFNDCEANLKGKKIALFGSYGWGDGEWMRNWQATCENDGAVLVAEPVICNDAPEADTLEALNELGKALA
ncbi:MAG: flavodoxin [Pseudoruminococcus massiliensis]|jgi:flavodoxin I|uniref:flavodoxin n=1 Tax=Pseudoruminococcus massiliensis TaxID=2086583 RepID=UPI0039929B01|nr:flavodoxin [Oscillospiraceae bacterium]